MHFEHISSSLHTGGQARLKFSTPYLFLSLPLSANRLKPLQGPRVGEKTPIDAITAEYAKADPVYVAKTMVRVSTYRQFNVRWC